MPQSNSWRDLIRLVLFTFAAWALWALGKNDAKPGAVYEKEPNTETTRKRSGFSKRRLATSLAFATLFFAGAAFTAGAGDQAACLVDDCTPAAEAEAATTEAAEPEGPPVADEPAAEDPAPEEPVAEDPPADDPAPAPADDGTGGGSDDGQQAEDPADPGDGSADQPSDDGTAPVPGAEEGQNGGGNAPGGDNGSGGGNQPAEEPETPSAGPGS